MTMTKAEAGRLGGQATVKKYGREWMKEIGEIGGMMMHERYSIQPYGTSDHVLVDRETNKMVSRLSGKKIA